MRHARRVETVKEIFLPIPIDNHGARLQALLRIRYQLLGGLLLAVVLPVLARISVGAEVMFERNITVGVISAVLAHGLGYSVYRRMATFPGVAAASYLLPSFLFSYGVVFLVVLLLRLDYSRFLLVASLVLSIAWYLGLSLVMRRLQTYRLAVIPGGDVGKLSSIQGITWLQLTDAQRLPHKVNGVVVDLRADLPVEWERFIADTALSGLPVYHVQQIMESLTGRVEIEHLSENTFGLLNPDPAYSRIKHSLDWLAALGVLVFLSPLLVLVALLVRLESPGPALFRQQRIGYRGQYFIVYKFRTMRSSGQESEIEDAITKHEDGRITRIGRFLRRTRIDELPQSINVLRGEMSWIGPRPEAVVLSRWYERELPFYRYRHIVRPGISGWAQVVQGHVATVDDVLEKLHYDFFYIKNFSPWLDLVIILRTIKTVLSGYGAR